MPAILFKIKVIEKLSLLLLLAICTSILQGQDYTPYFNRLTVEDGLSEGTNHFILKDSRGFVWLSSLNGLNRFDGRHVKVYKPGPSDSLSMYGQNIQSTFFETDEHDLWFTTYEGLNCYHRKTDHFKYYPTLDDKGDTIFWNHIFHLDKNQYLWILVDTKMLYHFHIPTKKFHFKHELKERALRATAITDDMGNVKQVIYVGYQTMGMEITNYEKGEITGSVLKFGEGDHISLVIKKAVVAGNAWYLATDKGFATYHHDSGNLSFHRPSLGRGVMESCQTISSLDNDNILAVVGGKNLFVFNIQQERFTGQIEVVDRNQPSVSMKPNISQIFRDYDGGIWLSTESQGVRFYHPRKQKFRVNKPSTDNTLGAVSFDVKTMVEDNDNRIWCGTFNGIVIYDEKANTYELRNKSDRPGPIKSVLQLSKLFKDAKGRIWILTWGGHFVWSPESNRIMALPETGNVFLDGLQLRNGRIVLAAYGGGLFEVTELPGGEFRTLPIDEVKTTEPFVSLWENDQGKLFGCISLKEIWIMDPEKDFNVVQKIPLLGISQSFCQQPGNPSIWFANSYGLVRLALQDGQYQPVLYTEKDGLSSSVVYALDYDRDGKLWLGTNNGISSCEPDVIRFQNYGIVDGLAALQYNPFAVLQRKNGQLWFGSVDGITIFHPDSISLLETPARPAIVGIRVNDQYDPTLHCHISGATNVCEIQGIVLGYDRNTLSFSFAALEYSYPAASLFRYKLSDIDPDWVDAGRENFARYAKLPPGKYTFSIKAANSDGIWSDGHSLAIVIEPPFTRSPLFFALMILLCIFAVWGLFQYRSNKRLQKAQQEAEKRQALENERQRIARDVHDDLGSSLSALSLMTEIARYKNSKEELKDELDKINAASRELSGKIREVIWTVNASNDTLAGLFSYMNQYALELLENADMDCRIMLPDNIPDIAIGGEHRRTLFLAFKEALNNITKHAGATLVKVIFQADGSRLEVVVEDNGKGFDPALLTHSTGNGLLNMQSRLRDIGGTCTFKTGNTGTRVTFTLGLADKVPH